MKKPKTKLQLKKKKARERKAQERVKAKRKAAFLEKKQREAEEAVFDLEAAEFDKVEPIRNPDTVERKKLEKEHAIADQLMRNLEILKALEEEHLKQKLEREELHAELEAKGYNTLEEKMEYLKKEAEKEGAEHMKEFNAEKGVFSEFAPPEIPDSPKPF
jgi:hypothetical protein